MTPLEECQSALQSQNCQAFLHLIRAGESGQTADAYRVMFGGSMFDSFDAHPNIVHTAGSLRSTAAGAYQFLFKTWQAVSTALGLPDFSPLMQDIGAVYLIRGRGALADVLAGNIKAAISKCCKEWASLPGSPYGQPTRTLEKALATYKSYGGVLDAQPAPQVAQPADVQPVQPAPEPKDIPMPTVNDVIDSPLTKFALAAINPLLAAVPEFLHLFTDKTTGQTVPERNVAAVTKIVSVAQQALQDAGKDAPNEQSVAQLVSSDPEARSVAREALMGAYYQIAVGEAGGGGIDGARKASAAYQQPGTPGFWLNPAFWISMLLMAMPFMLLADVFYVHPDSYVGEIRTQIVTGLIAVIGMVGGYWIGTSFSSAKKDDRTTAQ